MNNESNQEHKLETDGQHDTLTKSDILKKPYKERLEIYNQDPDGFNKIMNA